MYTGKLLGLFSPTNLLVNKSTVGSSVYSATTEYFAGQSHQPYADVILVLRKKKLNPCSTRLILTQVMGQKETFFAQIYTPIYHAIILK